MSDESRHNFREYATRVSFNVNLSRNQIAVLRSVRAEAEMPLRREFWNNGSNESGYKIARREYEEQRADSRNLFVPGVKPLIAMGLITWTDPAKMKPKWSEHVYRLTRAGELMCELLEIAGLIPMTPANRNLLNDTDDFSRTG